MKTKTINLYQFSELSPEGKEKALHSLCDINVDHDWWDYIYEDAERIGLKITSFETDRYAKGKLTLSPEEVCNQITKEHGYMCETVQTAKKYLEDRANLGEEPSDGKLDDLKDEFLKSLLEDYRIILSKEYEYLTSDEQIIETILANDYYFTEDGKIG